MNSKSFARLTWFKAARIDEGYRYLAEIDASVQGLSANDACGALVIATQSLRVELQITFVWRPKKGAAYPGEKAQLIVSSAP